MVAITIEDSQNWITVGEDINFKMFITAVVIMDIINMVHFTIKFFDCNKKLPINYLI